MEGKSGDRSGSPYPNQSTAESAGLPPYLLRTYSLGLRLVFSGRTPADSGYLRFEHQGRPFAAKMLQGIPGVIGVLMIDQDGKLLYKNGRFDTSPQELGAGIAVNLSAITIVGKLLNQEMSTVLTEFNKLKIYQIQF